MWSSEFEWTAISKVVAKLIEWQDKQELVLFSYEDWAIEWLCHISKVKEAKLQAEKLLLGDKHRHWNLWLQEPMFSRKTSNFLCLDNAYFFSTSWDALRYLKRIDDVKIIKKYIEKIERTPKTQTIMRAMS